MAVKGNIASDLLKLLQSGEGADVTLVVGESELPAHSFILAVRSPVFAAMLRNPMQEASSRRIEITDVQEAALWQMLWFIYTDTVPELESVAAELLAAADKYDLPLLKERCEEQLTRHMGVENAAASAALAVVHGCPRLKAAAVEFIATHPEVMATTGWERMLRDNAGAAVEICKQLAAAQSRPTSQSLPPKTGTKRTSTEAQLSETSESRSVPQEIKQKMATNLIQAAGNGCAREVWALLVAGAPKDARDSGGNTALHLAAANGHGSTVKCLLDGGLDVNAVNSTGQTPLHKATQRVDTDIMWVLLAASAKIDAQDNQGQTPLHVAAQKEYATDSKYCQNSSHTFCYQKHRDYPSNVVKFLLMAGARQDIKNASGKTPENVATSFTKSAFSTYNDLR